jgi:hypothetical protein
VFISADIFQEFVGPPKKRLEESQPVPRYAGGIPLEVVGFLVRFVV